MENYQVPESAKTLAVIGCCPYAAGNMNRIYQGRVTAVQQRQARPADEMGGLRKARTGTETEWQTVEYGEALLWRHYELFQDEINRMFQVQTK